MCCSTCEFAVPVFDATSSWRLTKSGARHQRDYRSRFMF